MPLDSILAEPRHRCLASRDAPGCSHARVLRSGRGCRAWPSGSRSTRPVIHLHSLRQRRKVLDLERHEHNPDRVPFSTLCSCRHRALRLLVDSAAPIQVRPERHKAPENPSIAAPAGKSVASEPPPRSLATPLHSALREVMEAAMEAFIGFAEVAGTIIAALGLAICLEWLALSGLLRLMPHRPNEPRKQHR
jgi:hypothetical protein